MLLKDAQYLMLQNRCLHEMNQDDSDKTIALHQNESLNLHSLETVNLGNSILTLEEALETVGPNVESKPFMIKSVTQVENNSEH